MLYVGFESELKRTFLQWRDGQRILGVKFKDEKVAKRFSDMLHTVVNNIGTPVSNSSSPRTSSRMSGSRPTPRSVPSMALFPRIESMAVPESYACCVCGNERNDLVLKTIGADGTVEGQVLRLPLKVPAIRPKKLCTECWIKNLLE